MHPLSGHLVQQRPVGASLELLFHLPEQVHSGSAADCGQELVW